MKKILFGTSALVAAGLFSGAAFAAGDDGVLTGKAGNLSLGMTMNATSGLGYSVTDNINPGNDTEIVLINDGEVQIFGKVTLENGLTFGGRTEIGLWGAAEKSGDLVDESSLYISGSFGKLETGEQDGAHDVFVNYGTGAGCFWNCAYDGGGYTFDEVSQVAGDFGVDGEDTGDAMKISYFTPSFSGFGAGVSYILDTTLSDDDEAVSTGRNGVGDERQAFEFGVGYKGTFDAFSVGVGAGYTARVDVNDQDSWGAALQVGFGGVSANIAWEDTDADDTMGFGGGLGYSTGPWGVGISASTNENGGNENFGIGANATYALGPGVATGASIGYASNDANQSQVAGGVWLGLSF